MQEMVYISKVTVMLDGKEDMLLTDFLFFLNQRYQGLKANDDYEVQAHNAYFLITGRGVKGASAVASVALAHSLKVVKLVMTGEFPEVHHRPNLFQESVDALEKWHKRYKPEVFFDTDAERLNSPLRTVSYGKRNSRWSLVMKPEVGGHFKGLYLELALGEDRAKQAWQFFPGCKDEIDWLKATRLCFAAAINTLLTPDFFRLNLDRDHYFIREKASVKERDYFTWLGGVAMEIVKECSKPGQNATLAEDSLKYLEKEIVRQLQIRARRVTIKV